MGAERVVGADLATFGHEPAHRSDQPVLGRGGILHDEAVGLRVPDHGVRPRPTVTGAHVAAVANVDRVAADGEGVEEDAARPAMVRPRVIVGVGRGAADERGWPRGVGAVDEVMPPVGCGRIDHESELPVDVVGVAAAAGDGARGEQRPGVAGGHELRVVLRVHGGVGEVPGLDIPHEHVLRGFHADETPGSCLVELVPGGKRLADEVFHAHIGDPAPRGEARIPLDRAAAVDRLDRGGDRSVEKNAVALDPRDHAVGVLLPVAGLPGIGEQVHAVGVDPCLVARPVDVDRMADRKPRRGSDGEARGSDGNPGVGDHDLREARVVGGGRSAADGDHVAGACARGDQPRRRPGGEISARSAKHDAAGRDLELTGDLEVTRAEVHGAPDSSRLQGQRSHRVDCRLDPRRGVTGGRRHRKHHRRRGGQVCPASTVAHHREVGDPVAIRLGAVVERSVASPPDPCARRPGGGGGGEGSQHRDGCPRGLRKDSEPLRGSAHGPHPDISTAETPSRAQGS